MKRRACQATLQLLTPSTLNVALERGKRLLVANTTQGAAGLSAALIPATLHGQQAGHAPSTQDERMQGGWWWWAGPGSTQPFTTSARSREPSTSNQQQPHLKRSASPPLQAHQGPASGPRAMHMYSRGRMRVSWGDTASSSQAGAKSDFAPDVSQLAQRIDRFHQQLAEGGGDDGISHHYRAEYKLLGQQLASALQQTRNAGLEVGSSWEPSRQLPSPRQGQCDRSSTAAVGQGTAPGAAAQQLPLRLLLTYAALGSFPAVFQLPRLEVVQHAIRQIDAMLEAPPSAPQLGTGPTKLGSSPAQGSSVPPPPSCPPPPPLACTPLTECDPGHPPLVATEAGRGLLRQQQGQDQQQQPGQQQQQQQQQREAGHLHSEFTWSVSGPASAVHSSQQLQGGQQGQQQAEQRKGHGQAEQTQPSTTLNHARLAAHSQHGQQHGQQQQRQQQQQGQQSAAMSQEELAWRLPELLAQLVAFSSRARPRQPPLHDTARTMLLPLRQLLPVMRPFFVRRTVWAVSRLADSRTDADARLLLAAAGDRLAGLSDLHLSVQDAVLAASAFAQAGQLHPALFERVAKLVKDRHSQLSAQEVVKAIQAFAVDHVTSVDRARRIWVNTDAPQAAGSFFDATDGSGSEVADLGVSSGAGVADLGVAGLGVADPGVSSGSKAADLGVSSSSKAADLGVSSSSKAADPGVSSVSNLAGLGASSLIDGTHTGVTPGASNATSSSYSGVFSNVHSSSAANISGRISSDLGASFPSAQPTHPCDADRPTTSAATPQPTPVPDTRQPSSAGTGQPSSAATGQPTQGADVDQPILAATPHPTFSSSAHQPALAATAQPTLGPGALQPALAAAPQPACGPGAHPPAPAATPAAVVPSKRVTSLLRLVDERHTTYRQPAALRQAVEALSQQVLERLPEFSVRQVSVVAWSLGAMHIRNNLLAELARHIADNLDSCTASDIATVMRACAMRDALGLDVVTRMCVRLCAPDVRDELLGRTKAAGAAREAEAGHGWGRGGASAGRTWGNDSPGLSGDGEVWEVGKAGVFGSGGAAHSGSGGGGSGSSSSGGGSSGSPSGQPPAPSATLGKPISSGGMSGGGGSSSGGIGGGGGISSGGSPSGLLPAPSPTLGKPIIGAAHSSSGGGSSSGCSSGSPSGLPPATLGKPIIAQRVLLALSRVGLRSGPADELCNLVVPRLAEAAGAGLVSPRAAVTLLVAASRLGLEDPHLTRQLCRALAPALRQGAALGRRGQGGADRPLAPGLAAGIAGQSGPADGKWKGRVTAGKEDDGRGSSVPSLDLSIEQLRRVLCSVAHLHAASHAASLAQGGAGPHGSCGGASLAQRSAPSPSPTQPHTQGTTPLSLSSQQPSPSPTFVQQSAPASPFPQQPPPSSSYEAPPGQPSPLRTLDNLGQRSLIRTLDSPGQWGKEAPGQRNPPKTLGRGGPGRWGERSPGTGDAQPASIGLYLLRSLLSHMQASPDGPTPANVAVAAWSAGRLRVADREVWERLRNLFLARGSWQAGGQANPAGRTGAADAAPSGGPTGGSRVTLAAAQSGGPTGGSGFTVTAAQSGGATGDSGVALAAAQSGGPVGDTRQARAHGWSLTAQQAADLLWAFGSSPLAPSPTSGAGPAAGVGAEEGTAAGAHPQQASLGPHLFENQGPEGHLGGGQGFGLHAGLGQGSGLGSGPGRGSPSPRARRLADALVGAALQALQSGHCHPQEVVEMLWGAARLSPSPDLHLALVRLGCATLLGWHRPLSSVWDAALSTRRRLGADRVPLELAPELLWALRGHVPDSTEARELHNRVLLRLCSSLDASASQSAGGGAGASASQSAGADAGASTSPSAVAGQALEQRELSLSAWGLGGKGGSPAALRAVGVHWRPPGPIGAPSASSTQTDAAPEPPAGATTTSLPGSAAPSSARLTQAEAGSVEAAGPARSPHAGPGFTLKELSVMAWCCAEESSARSAGSASSVALVRLLRACTDAAAGARQGELQLLSQLAAHVEACFKGGRGEECGESHRAKGVGVGVGDALGALREAISSQVASLVLSHPTEKQLLPWVHDSSDGEGSVTGSSNRLQGAWRTLRQAPAHRAMMLQDALAALDRGLSERLRPVPSREAGDTGRLEVDHQGTALQQGEDARTGFGSAGFPDGAQHGDPSLLLLPGQGAWRDLLAAAPAPLPLLSPPMFKFALSRQVQRLASLQG